ncbi:MAG: lytic transglycosylase domain-containing protein [Myxococcota bacterium]
MRRRVVIVLGAGVLLSAPAWADAEIQRKIAALRALTPRAPAAAAPPRSVGKAGTAGCSAARARRLDPAERTVVTMRAIRDASLRYGVSAELIRSVIRHESAGNPAAVSHKGAMGLMQLMPATARQLGVSCAFDPRQNVMGGTRYLREMRNRFGSWRLALAAYNAGPARVESGRRWPRETRNYVEQVLRTWRGSNG